MKARIFFENLLQWRKGSGKSSSFAFKALAAGAGALFLTAALAACSDLNYTDDGGKDKDDSEWDRDRVEAPAPDLSGESCANYKSKVRSFRPASDMLSTWLLGTSDENPLRYAENCILKSADESLKPLCDEEKILKEELRKYSNEPEVLEEIEEELEYIEDTKADYADILYDFAEEVDEVANDLEVEDPDNGWERIYNILITREARSYADIVALTARRFCGSDLRRDRRGK